MWALYFVLSQLNLTNRVTVEQYEEDQQPETTYLGLYAIWLYFLKNFLTFNSNNS